MKNLPNVGLPIILLSLLLIVFISRSSVNIGSGQAGVLFQTLGGGVVTDAPPKGEGFKIIAPWNRVVIYNVRQQEALERMQVLSSNGLEISLDISILYQPLYDELGLLHQTKGENYLNSVLLPNIRAVARSVVGRYTPEQLYSTKRDAIQNEIFEETRDNVLSQHIQLNSVLVRDVTLPTAIKEQESLEYEFRLVKAEQEAERQRIDAEGKAIANRILSASLTDRILREKGIEATLKLSESPNAKVIVIGSGEDGMPIILGGNN
jgi:regulator of protease activity HflC (stomatin/prohibitin superfamily)